MRISNFCITIVVLLLSCADNKEKCVAADEVTGIGMVVKSEMGFFRKEYENYFVKTINVDKLTEKEKAYSNEINFDKSYMFVCISMLVLHSNDSEIDDDTVRLIYPLLWNSSQKSTDVVIAGSYIFKASRMPEDAVRKSTLVSGCYYLVRSTWQLQYVYYPVRNYHLRSASENTLNVIDSLTEIVQIQE